MPKKFIVPVNIQIKSPHTGLTIEENLEKIGKSYHPIQMAHTSPGHPQVTSSSDSIELERTPPISEKKARHLPHDELCQTFCKFPLVAECTAAAAELLLMVLLSQFADLIVGVLPRLPILCMSGNPRVMWPVCLALLTAVQGSEFWSGPRWKLKRPWILSPILSPHATSPSNCILDYLGGKFKVGYNKRRFWVPYVCSAAVLMPDLPEPIRTGILQLSPLMLPIVFLRPKRDPSRSISVIEDTAPGSYDVELLSNFEDCANGIYVQLSEFQKWFRKKDKRLAKCLINRRDFLKFSHKGRFCQLQADDRAECLSMALAVFECYLRFASVKKHWISTDAAEQFLLEYWRLVLPESAPQDPSRETNSEPLVNSRFSDGFLFYTFLSQHFLPTHWNQIIHAAYGQSETAGLVHKIGNMLYLIMPRRKFLETYKSWLLEQGIPIFDVTKPHWEASVQRELQKAGIPVRGEKSNPSTWRYQFYSKDCTLTTKNIDCIALPLRQLPDFVQASFAEHFGEISERLSLQHPSETSRSESEGGKPL